MAEETPKLRFILGAAGSGKTRRCLAEAIEYTRDRKYENAKAIILVPDQATAQYERELLRLSDAAAISNIVVTGFARLPFFLSTKDSIETETVGTSIRRMMLYRAISRLGMDVPLLLRSADKVGVLDQILHFIDELKRSGTDLDALKDAVDEVEQPWLYSRVAEIRDATSELEKDMSLTGFIDALSASREYSKMLASHPPVSGLCIWIDGFSRFSAIECSVLRELFRIADTVSIALLLPPEILSGDAGTPESLVPVSLLGHTLSTYIELDKSAKKMKLTREYVRLESLDSPLRWAENRKLASLEKHLRSYGIRPVSESESSETDDSDSQGFAKVVEVPNRVCEVRFAAREIRRLVSNGVRYRDISVLTHSLESYKQLIQSMFRRFDIPFFLDSPRAISHHPAIRLVLNLVSYAVEPSFEELFRIARNPLVAMQPNAVDRLENHFLERGIWIEGIGSERLSRELKETDSAFETIDKALFQRLARFTRTARSSDSSANISNAILVFLKELDAAGNAASFASLDDDWETDLHNQAWDEAISVVVNIAGLCSADGMDLSLYKDLVAAALGKTSAKTAPPTLDQVTVSDIDRGRQMHPRYVFVLGLLEGEFPQSEPVSGMLSPDERLHLRERGIRLENDGVLRYIYERYLFYIACTRARDGLFLTVPVKESQDAVRSTFLKLLPEDGVVEFGSSDEPEIPAALSNATTAVELSGYLTRHMPDSPIAEAFCEQYEGIKDIYDAFSMSEFADLLPFARELRFRDGRKVSVTRLERLASCPFADYATSDLRLRERSIFSVDALSIGIIFHRTLKIALDESIERNISWRGGDRSALLAILKESYEQVIRDPDEAWSRNPYTEMVAEILYKDLKAFFESTLDSLNAGNFVPIAGEIGFGMVSGDTHIPFEVVSPSGFSYILAGKIDRIDLCEETGELAVIDYKSRPGAVNWAKVFYGLDLQLLMYGHALRVGANEVLARARLSNAARERLTEFEPRPTVLLRHAITPELKTANSAGDADESPKREKPRGIILESAAKMLDPKASGYSSLYSFRVKKDGSIGGIGSGDVLPEEQWQVLWRFFEYRLGTLLTMLDSGDIHVHPVSSGTSVSCDYCIYSPVCRINPDAGVERLKPPGVEGSSGKLDVIDGMRREIGEDA
ncbi:PD-(D/E)XK nuclease family protein [bacterium]|nr:PD-(D/E)XK nuclease family protein [bacterium]